MIVKLNKCECSSCRLHHELQMLRFFMLPWHWKKMKRIVDSLRDEKEYLESEVRRLSAIIKTNRPPQHKPYGEF